MTSVTLYKEASVSCPTSENIYVRTNVGAGESLQLDPEFLQQWITIHAEGADFYVNFSTGAASPVVLFATSGLGPPVAPAVDGAWRIPDGAEMHFNLFELKSFQTTNPIFFLNHRTDILVVPDATAFIRFYRSSGPVGQ